MVELSLIVHRFADLSSHFICRRIAFAGNIVEINRSSLICRINTMSSRRHERELTFFNLRMRVSVSLISSSLATSWSISKVERRYRTEDKNSLLAFLNPLDFHFLSQLCSLPKMPSQYLESRKDEGPSLRSSRKMLFVNL